MDPEDHHLGPGPGLNLDPRRDSAISALSYHSASTVTESISSDNPVFRFVEENGRTYHAYKQGRYPVPNDAREQGRSTIEHQVWHMTLKDKLYLAPIEQLNNVLDIGTGTGLWPFEIALRHPNAKVIGTDLSPIQPQYIPTNCQFEIDDAEDEWLYRQKFDLIHSRCNLFSFQSPETVVTNAFGALERNGWFESQDMVFPFKCDDGSWEGSAIQRWNQVLEESIRRSQRRLYVEDYAQMFRDVGLVNVTERLFIWPLGPWHQGPRNEHLRELGRWARKDIMEGMEALGMALMTKFGGLSRDEVLKIVGDAKNDLWNNKIHVYVQVVVTMGQKA